MTIRKPLVSFPDAEAMAVDLLDDLLAEWAPHVEVGVEVPTSWAAGDRPHIQVAHDGTPSIITSIAARCTLRFVARASTTDEAKQVALLAQGLLLAATGTGGFDSIVAGTGIFPAEDRESRTQLASFTVTATVHAEPIAAIGS